MQAAGQLFCQSLFTGIVQMTIDVCCHLNVAVSHPFLHVLEVAAVVQKQTGAAMSKLVKTDVRKTMFFQKVCKSKKEDSKSHDFKSSKLVRVTRFELAAS